MQTYFKNEKLTKSVIKNGWFYTNDIACFDENGNIILPGRKRNFIKIASDELICIDEIQQFINQLDLVSEAVVCPYRKNDTEYLAAFVVVNIYPEQVSEMINIHPAVFENFCLGIKDENIGEKLVSAVVLKQDSKLDKSELLTFLRPFLCVKHIALFFGFLYSFEA